MKKILLTGGSGFIGRNILESDLAQKYDIVAPYHAQIDWADDKAVQIFFSDKEFDAVIHAAVKPSHRNAPDFLSLYYTNMRMFMNLERMHNRYGKMLVTGSGAIYDSQHYLPKRNEDQYIDNIPSNEHGFCKYTCARIIEKSDNILDLRIFGIFGKYEDYSIRFISNMICKTLFGLPLTIKQNRKFDYLFIDDLMPVIEHFLENEAQFRSYNVTPDDSVELVEIAYRVRAIIGGDNPIIVSNKGMGTEYSGSNARLRSSYPDIRFTQLDTAIYLLAEWYKRNRSSLDIEKLKTDK